MKKFRSFAVLAAVAASVSMLSACSDNERDELADTGAAMESPATSAPPATTPEPTETVPSPAPAPAPSGDSSAMGGGSATDITPEPDTQ